MTHHDTPTVDTRSALAGLHLLRHCPRAELDRLARDTDVVDLPADRVIDRVGRSAYQFVGIVDGYVRGRADDGREIVLGPGDHLGAVELVADRRHSMTFTTITPVTVLATFGPAFRAVAGRNPGLAAAIRRAAADRVAPTRRPALARVP